ncbi:leucyl aminopeptidase [Sphingorhabdus sp.]|uniref:leucyl aminopeptidase n=1 Tax=Sphingorhabdus sp. TaxID=1902408 RepID=UPI00391D1FAE
MHRTFIALALASAAITPAFGQADVIGSGVSPSAAAHSQTRPISFSATVPTSGALVIMMRNSTLPTDIVDMTTAQALNAAIAAAKFEGKEGTSLSLRGIGSYARIVLTGTGEEGDRVTNIRNASGKAAQDLRDESQPVSITGGLNQDEAAAAALGYAMGQYRFDRYKTVDRKTPPTNPVLIVSNDAQGADSLWKSRHSALAEGVSLSRDLTNEPANVIYPETFVERVRAAFGNTANVKIEVLDEPMMRKLGMGTLVGVGQGSRRPSRLMLVEYRGGADGAPLAMVGKGITFDSGGTSLKPGAGMWEMKADMSGAANIMGAVLSLAKSKAQVNVIGVAALSENMPGGNAQRPGDVVRTMSGKTIEILNTDAEGRLVMADANEYVIANKKPGALVNMATLTGSIVGALNDEYAGLFSRDDRLAAAVVAAGTATGEEVWRMPLHKNYLDDMKSDIADIKNVVEGGGPGAGLGATFVGFFVDKAVPWAHLDIAGVNWADKAGPVTPKGASGWGVQLLDALARNWR